MDLGVKIFTMVGACCHSTPTSALVRRRARRHPDEGAEDPVRKTGEMTKHRPRNGGVKRYDRASVNEGHWKRREFDWICPSSKHTLLCSLSRHPRSRTPLPATKGTHQAATIRCGLFRVIVQKHVAGHVSVGYLVVRQRPGIAHVKWSKNGHTIRHKIHKTSTISIQQYLLTQTSPIPTFPEPATDSRIFTHNLFT
jgi:hypothetical protein